MRKNESKKSGTGFALNAAVGGASGLITALLLLAALALLTSSGKLPENLMGEGTVLACALGAILGALTASMRQRGRRLLTGLASGGAMFLMTLILSALGENGIGFGALTPAIFAAAVLGGAAGGMLCAAPGKRKR